MNPKCPEEQIEIRDYVPQSFWYEEQFKKYIAQVMMLFDELYVETGIRRSGRKEYIDVPVYYGSMDRVAAWFLSDSTQNKPVKVPAISIFMDSIDVAPHRYKGNDFVSRKVHMEVGGVYPDDVRTSTSTYPAEIRGSVYVELFDTTWVGPIYSGTAWLKTTINSKGKLTVSWN